MSSSDESAASSQHHTPFCDDGCTIEHHPLLQQILSYNYKLREQGKADLIECIRMSQADGWNVDDPIPDTVPEFRYPMLHWCAALNKLQLANFLVKSENCSTAIQTKQGDTPLHRCIVCLKLRSKQGHLAVPLLANNLPVCNSKGQTPLLLLAERLHQGHIAPGQFSDWLMNILEATTKMVDVGQRLKTFNTQNLQGDTALHLLCEVKNMLPSVRRLVQEARCNVKIRNKLGLTAMDVASNCSFYDYVTEIKSVLPTSSLISPLRSSHPMNQDKKKTRKTSESSAPPRSRTTSESTAPPRSRTKEKEKRERSTEKKERSSEKKERSSEKKERSSEKKFRAKKRSRSLEKRSSSESRPPKLEKMKAQTPQTEQKYHNTPTTSKEEKQDTQFTTPETPLSSASKRPRKGTPYRVNRPPGASKEEQEQRKRVSNLDKILQSQCHGTPVGTATHSGSVVERSSKCSGSESGRSPSDSDMLDALDHGASTSGENKHSDEHSDDNETCLLCNLENGSKIPTRHPENGSKVSEMRVSTAAAGGGAANEPGASGEMPNIAGDREDNKGNSKLLTYLHMHQDFQKEIVNKIHKDRRDIEKKIVEQEGSIQVTAKELAKVTAESNDINRKIHSFQQQLVALQARENELKVKQDKLRKNKKAKETKLGESRTQLAVIAQSLLELQS